MRPVGDGDGGAQSLLRCRVQLQILLLPSSIAKAAASAAAATYHIGGFLISIGEIGCVVDRFRWCRRWTGVVRGSLFRSAEQESGGKFERGPSVLPVRRPKLLARGQPAGTPSRLRHQGISTQRSGGGRPRLQVSIELVASKGQRCASPPYCPPVVYDAPLKEHPCAQYGLQQEGRR